MSGEQRRFPPLDRYWCVARYTVAGLGPGEVVGGLRFDPAITATERGNTAIAYFRKQVAERYDVSPLAVVIRSVGMTRAEEKSDA